MRIFLHEFSMPDRDAKPKTANRIDVGYVPIERIDNMAGALFGDSTVQRKYVVKLSFIITAARPANIGQVNIIGNAEILKWAEQLAGSIASGSRISDAMRPLK